VSTQGYHECPQKKSAHSIQSFGRYREHISECLVILYRKKIFIGSLKILTTYTEALYLSIYKKRGIRVYRLVCNRLFKIETNLRLYNFVWGFTLYGLRSTFYTLHSTLYTLHSTLYTLQTCLLSDFQDWKHL